MFKCIEIVEHSFLFLLLAVILYKVYLYVQFCGIITKYSKF